MWLMAIAWQSQRGEAQPAAVRAVADSFYAAVERADWASAARFLDSAAVGRRLRERIQRARTELPMSRPTVESLMAADTTLPRAVAEWRLRDMTRWPERRFRDYSDEYAGISSFEALLALPVEEAGARWLEAMDPTSRIRRLLRERGCDTRSFESIQAHLFRLRTLGALVADSARAYVLAETAANRAEGPPEAQVSPAVVSMVRVGQAWRIVPTYNLLSGGAMAGISGC
jgi:hypothetical protein